LGISAFAAPEEGQAYLAGIEEFAKLPSTFADTVFAATSLLVIVLLFVGNVLLGVAVWRSGTLPRWAGALWAAAAVLMYPLGLVIAATVTGSTPDGARWGVADSDRRGVDGVGRPSPTLHRGGGGNGPAEGAMTPA
jgi:hypothetical protein